MAAKGAATNTVEQTHLSVCMHLHVHLIANGPLTNPQRLQMVSPSCGCKSIKDCYAPATTIPSVMHTTPHSNHLAANANSRHIEHCAYLCESITLQQAHNEASSPPPLALTASTSQSVYAPPFVTCGASQPAPTHSPFPGSP